MLCQPFENCFDFVNEARATVSCSDKSKALYSYENVRLDNLTKYNVDNCLIREGAKKCDYLLLNCTQKKAFFIELKGSDLVKAVEQIDKTIDLLKSSLTEFSIYARIVLTRINTMDLKNQKYLKLEKKIKQLHGDLRKESVKMVERNGV